MRAPDGISGCRLGGSAAECHCERDVGIQVKVARLIEQKGVNAGFSDGIEDRIDGVVDGRRWITLSHFTTGTGQRRKLFQGRGHLVDLGVGERHQRNRSQG